MSPSDPASGSEQLGELLERWEGLGFTCHFGSREAAMVICFTCHHSTPAIEMQVVHIARLEGASDPDDMLAVIALRCPTCDSNGMLVCGYGPNADLVDTEVLQALPNESV